MTNATTFNSSALEHGDTVPAYAEVDDSADPNKGYMEVGPATTSEGNEELSF